jgi:hypothetical protein
MYELNYLKNYMVDIDSDHDIFSDSSARESRRSRKKSDKPPVVKKINKNYHRKIKNHFEIY